MSVLTYKTLNTSLPRYLSQRINRHYVYAGRLRHCSSSRSLVPTSRNVLFDALHRLSVLTSCVCHRKRFTVCVQI